MGKIIWEAHYERAKSWAGKSYWEHSGRRAKGRVTGAVWCLEWSGVGKADHLEKWIMAEERDVVGYWVSRNVRGHVFLAVGRMAEVRKELADKMRYEKTFGEMGVMTKSDAIKRFGRKRVKMEVDFMKSVAKK
jgi:hypothetical protein